MTYNTSEKFNLKAVIGVQKLIRQAKIQLFFMVAIRIWDNENGSILTRIRQNHGGMGKIGEMD